MTNLKTGDRVKDLDTDRAGCLMHVQKNRVTGEPLLAVVFDGCVATEYVTDPSRIVTGDRADQG